MVFLNHQISEESSHGKKIPSPCIQTPQKNQLNCREMLGRILRMVLMKEKEEQLFSGQWLKRTERTTCAAGSSQKDEWWFMPLLRQARLQSCWMNEKGGLIVWTGKKTFASENICTFGLKSSDFRWLGDQNCLAQKKLLCSIYLLQQVWLCVSSWRSGVGESWREGHLLLALIRPSCRMCFYCRQVFSPPPTKRGCQRLWFKTFTARGCPCSVRAWLCSATWAGAPVCLRWLLCVCRQKKYRLLGENEHLSLAYRGGAVNPNNSFMKMNVGLPVTSSSAG